jgi:hypothetical protein
MGQGVHGEAHVEARGSVVHAYHCARCGKFTVPDEVQQRLVDLGPARRQALTKALIARGSLDARGAGLEAADLIDR